MNTTIDDEREAARRIVESGRRDLAVMMVLLGGLRHGNNEAYRERIAMLEISEEILKESSYYKYLIEKGEEQGAAKGRLEQVRLMHDVLNDRFGNIPDWAEAKLAEASADVLRNWLRRSVSAPNIVSVFE